MKEKRGIGYIFTGLFLGILLGLVYAWFINPVSYSDTSPAVLREDYQAQYRLMIARSYQYNHDLGRTKARLALLKDETLSQTLRQQVLDLTAEGASTTDIEALQSLLAALGDNQFVTTPWQTAAPVVTTATPDMGATPILGETPALGETPSQVGSPTARPSETVPITTSTAMPTSTPMSLLTATPVIQMNFASAEKSVVCNPALPEKLLQVEVFNSDGDPQAGVPIKVSWDSGESTFYTGLHPEMSAGYADFLMSQGRLYSVEAGNSGKQASSLMVTNCRKADGTAYLGGVKVIFK